MAVVHLKSTLYRDPSAVGPLIPLGEARGRVFNASGSVANAADDSTGSTYELIRLPSHAILLPQTSLYVENWGFAQVVLGGDDDPDAFLDVARSAATTQAPVAISDANYPNELWELLGLTADPGGELALKAVAEAGATGAGSLAFHIVWSI